MKHKIVLFAVLAAGAFLASEPAYAHHSFAATYFEDQKVTIEGDLVQFLYRNPHSYVHVEVKDDKGEVTRWAVEWGAGDDPPRPRARPVRL